MAATWPLSLARLELLVIVVVVTVAHGGPGGPPPPYHDLPTSERAIQQDLPLPGKGIVSFPTASVQDLQGRKGELGDDPYPDFYRGQPPTLDDVDKLDSAPQPPLRYAFPVDFRPVDVEAPSLMPFIADVPVAAVDPVVKGLSDWLPDRVVSWLPTLPTLPTLQSLVPGLPNYIPGFELEAEVHRGPTTVPHIPTPNELLQRVNHLVDDAMTRLHKKQEQLVELIKCTCPRPARCEGLFQEFLTISNPAAPAIPGSPAARPSGALEPGISLFAELTKPSGGHGPGFGFYVDKTGPHLGHHIHNTSAAVPPTIPATAVTPTPASPSAPSATAALAAQASQTDAVEFPES